MKKILLVFFIFFSTYCFSQVAHVFSIGDNNTYTIAFSKNDNNYDFDLSMIGEDNTINFTLPKLDIVTFKNVLYSKLNELNEQNGKERITVGSNSKIIDEIFFTVVANIDTIDDLNYAPVAGVLNIDKEVNLYRDKNNDSFKLKGIKFHIDNVQIVFQQGFIQDVIVDGKIIKDTASPIDENLILAEFEDAELRFTNYYGIGFSSKKNFRKLNEMDLYPNKNKSLDKKFTYIKIKEEGGEKKRDTAYLYELNELHIKLGEVIKSYDFTNDLFTTDYSPANIKIAIEGDKSMTLYKDKTYKILEARVFSDFLGFDSEKPNGLIQFEVEKKFNFNTTRYKFLTYRIRTGVGFMEYLKINGGVTKIEDNNRYLIPEMEDEAAVSNTGEPILINKRYTTPIAVLNHQVWNIGVNTNIFLFDMPLIKSQLHINAGFKYAQTKVMDSLRTYNPDLTIHSEVKEYNLNYWLFYPEVMWHILPEARYGFYASWRPEYFYSITDGIEFSGELDQLTSNRRANVSSWINEFELLGYLFVNEEKQNGKLFVKLKINSEMGYSKNNFSQFQVGYAFYILGRGKQQ
jgi:hypothetical protein